MSSQNLYLSPGQSITLTITLGAIPPPGPVPPGQHGDQLDDIPAILPFPSTPAVSSASRPAVPSGLTLRQIHERWIAPENAGDRAPGTAREDRTALDRWERCCGAIGRAGLPANQIDSELLAKVKTHLLAGHDGVLSPASIRKVFSLVRKCLRRAEQEREIDRVPTIPRIRQPHRRPGVVTVEELDLLYKAADAATWPRARGLKARRLSCLQPGDWWRAWFALFAVYGARTADIVSYKHGADGLLWSSVIDQPECPDASIPGLSCPHGWLEFVPGKTSRTRGEPLLLPRSAVINQHLDRFREIDPMRVFPNGRSKIQFAESFQAIRSAAGVSDDVTIADTGTRRGRKMRSIRKFCSNAWDGLREGLGGWVLGHIGQGTNAAHYRLALPDIVRLMDQYPLPASMAPTVKTS